ncbi:hypothetical protein GJ744_011994 [Endocarpon pusillum]|uniref:Uncharacterized protein n=1 Tax=Endocarpon pusillum TaxID=364733 RepID=A0A8H7EAN3_9EURO|nr:hypothetical protein GJ744_011994 [Endocarpon pusillum]
MMNIGSNDLYDTKALSMLELLLKYEADQTGACYPQKSGHPWVIELAQGTDEDRPLETAVWQSTPEFVRMLLQAGAKLTAGMSNKVPQPVLEMTFLRNDKHGPEVVKLLLSLLPENPADWNKFASNNHFVSYLGAGATVEIATYILKKRPDLLHETDSRGQKAISIAYHRYCNFSTREQLMKVMEKYGAQDEDIIPGLSKSIRDKIRKDERERAEKEKERKQREQSSKI